MGKKFKTVEELEEHIEKLEQEIEVTKTKLEKELEKRKKQEKEVHELDRWFYGDETEEGSENE